MLGPRTANNNPSTTTTTTAMAFANLFKGLPTTAAATDEPHEPRQPQRKVSTRVPYSQEKDHDGGFAHTRQQQQWQSGGGRELNASNEKRRGYHNERQGHKTRKSFSHKDNRMGNNNKQPSLGFTQQLEDYIHSRDSLNKTNSVPEGDCKRKHNNKNESPQQQQEQRSRRTQKEEYNRHRPNNRGRHSNRRGQQQASCTRRDFSRIGTNTGVKKKHMTQEFKEHNGVEWEGQWICRHFLCGQCVKGDECQLPHVQKIVNNMLKEACKFYIQGWCQNGENCPFMHNSFPCKHFHARGKCERAECRFSHEPLTDLTQKLLDGALKRDLIYAEIQKKTQQVESGQSKNTEEPLAAENIAVDNPKPEIRLDPIRPNFYNSSCSSETERHDERLTLGHAGVSADKGKDGVSQCDTDPALSSSVASSHPGDDEIVPYSVEAVLGSQISKSLPSLPGAPEGPQMTPPSFPSTSSIHCPSNSEDQSTVPYSVNTVLGSYKSEETSKRNLSSGSRALYIPLSSKMSPSTREIPDPPGYSATCKDKVLYADNSGCESNIPIPLGKRVEGQTACQGPLRQFSNMKKWPNLPHTSVGSKDLFGNISTFQKPPITKVESQVPVAQNSMPQNKTIAHPTADITASQVPIQSRKNNNTAFCSAGLATIDVVAQSKNKTAFHNLFSNLGCQSSDPKSSVEIKSRPCAPSDRGEIVQSLDPSTSRVRQKCDLKQNKKTMCQLSDTLRLTDNAQPPDQARVKFNDADCKITMSQNVKPAPDSIKPRTQPFHSLFARPLGEVLSSILTRPDSLTALSCPQDSSQSSCSAPNSADCKKKVTLSPVVESGEATERPFLSLFVSIPCEPSVPIPPETTETLETINCTSNLGGHKENGSHLGVKRLFSDCTSDSDTDTVVETQPSKSPPRSKSKQVKCSIATEYNQNINQTQSESSGTTSCPRTQTDQDSKATKNSVLSTLFIRLSPYHEDMEPQSYIQNNLSLGQQQEEGVEEKKADEHHELMEKMMQDEPVRIPVESSLCLSMSEHPQQCQSVVPQAPSTEETIPTQHGPSFHSTAVQRTAAGSASRMACPPVDQVRTTATHRLSIQPVTQPHPHLVMKQSCQQRKSANGNGDNTPFSAIKNLFKTLDPAGSPFGQ